MGTGARPGLRAASVASVGRDEDRYDVGSPGRCREGARGFRPWASADAPKLPDVRPSRVQRPRDERLRVPVPVSLPEPRRPAVVPRELLQDVELALLAELGSVQLEQ